MYSRSTYFFALDFSGKKARFVIYYQRNRESFRFGKSLIAKTLKN
jgi:hypothetical protein